MQEKIYKMHALGAVIKDFITMQFISNGITHEEGALIMEGVNGYFQKAALDGVMLGMIQKPQEGEVSDGKDNTKEP